MNSPLAAIISRIWQEEGPAFQDFHPATFALSDRGKPIDVVPLMERRFSLIAEVKCGSPSRRGLFRAGFDPVGLARTYSENGAAAISVVTEKNFFFGAKKHLPLIRSCVTIPLLRKDFIVHPRQVYESYNLGADFVLLIAACLDDRELESLCSICDSLGMRPLIEVHDAGEIRRVLPLRPRLIGINNRDLNTLAVDWQTSLELRPLIPPETQVISESGIHSADQIATLKKNGFAGALVGEHLLRQDDPGHALRELLHGQD